MKIVMIAGDGVGPEITAAAVRVVEATGLDVEWIEADAGETALAKHGDVAPDHTLDLIRETGLALKGPFYTPSGGSRRSPNQRIRRELELYACVRPIDILSLPRPVLLVRENVEDMYAAVEWSPAPGVAEGLKIATWRGCTRIVRHAFERAAAESRSRVTLVHKANNLKLTEGMLLDAAREVAEDFPHLRLDDLIVDTAAAQLVLEPESFDVIVTSNTFGDILSSVGAAVAGSLGLVGSLNRGDNVIVAEASHGHVGDLTGTGRVNPLAMISAAGLLLRDAGRTDLGDAVLDAVRETREKEIQTLDLGGEATTEQVTDAVVRSVRDAVTRQAA
ncbi:isocitrate/isopropylmalate dehydrogenase family protein [Streptomyces sp. NPDC050164]|uniref:isocitrate/isopropylmalate dehydrogenase family protein n=1 Tax=Streptomyces sp. NPDC050164 TaxID=3365605 RepID=UPI00379DF586